MARGSSEPITKAQPCPRPLSRFRSDNRAWCGPASERDWDGSACSPRPSTRAGNPRKKNRPPGVDHRQAGGIVTVLGTRTLNSRRRLEDAAQRPDPREQEGAAAPPSIRRRPRSRSIENKAGRPTSQLPPLERRARSTRSTSTLAAPAARPTVPRHRQDTIALLRRPRGPYPELCDPPGHSQSQRSGPTSHNVIGFKQTTCRAPVRQPCAAHW